VLVKVRTGRIKREGEKNKKYKLGHKFLKKYQNTPVFYLNKKKKKISGS
jgi:hypothetical protein